MAKIIKLSYKNLRSSKSASLRLLIFAYRKVGDKVQYSGSNFFQIRLNHRDNRGGRPIDKQRSDPAGPSTRPHTYASRTQTRKAITSRNLHGVRRICLPASRIRLPTVVVSGCVARVYRV